MNHGQNKKLAAVVFPTALLDDASATTTEIDTLGFDYCEIIVYYGTSDIAMAALAVTESDASGSGHANVTGLVYGTSVNTAGSTSTLPSATDDNKFFKFEIDLKGRKRYLDTTITAGDGTAGSWIYAWAELTRKGEGIDSASEAGCSQILRV